jgi:hypothetical protein
MDTGSAIVTKLFQMFEPKVSYLVLKVLFNIVKALGVTIYIVKRRNRMNF